ncbi:MAG: transglutaminase domain-containing protein [Termitinemataceae bacterium]|nr:MAG: transglutaminase domain-containing protein [Termitinemataceae bacterium]
MNVSALSCRSIALFAILYQVRLIAGDLADTSVFITGIAAAFLSAFVLVGGRTPLSSNLRFSDTPPAGALPPQRPRIIVIQSIIILLLIPLTVRLFIIIPRYFIDEPYIQAIIKADSFLLTYDRNNFVLLLPFYFAAITTVLSIVSRRASRFCILADCVLLFIMFTLTRSSAIEVYKFPIVKIASFVSIALLEIIAAMLCAPKELKTTRKEYGASLCIVVSIGILLGALLIKPMQESAMEANGGLIKPKMFSFDFAPYLRLESEIKMNNDLVFIVRKENVTVDPFIGKNDFNFDDDLSISDYHFLMRRYVLSAYNSGSEKDPSVGFFRNDEIDEISQASTLPRGSMKFDVMGKKMRSPIKQEYYLVNIDSSAFIAMNEIQSVMPYESWDASSFKSAYSVESLSSFTYPGELRHAVSGIDFSKSSSIIAKELQLSEDDYRLYTDFGDSTKKTKREKRITELMQQLCADKTNYFDKVQTVYQYFKFGQYRYSLKPGIAIDGDQLSHFIFESKKGYCSYFAFAFAAMLRSGGIPCRVAVGFFMDPETEKLGFYPVSSNMAHAWVEVWYPQYGWIEYDPTSENMAAGEEFEFSLGFDPSSFEKLLKEILDNHNKLKTKEAIEDEVKPINENAKKIIKVAKKMTPPFVLLFFIFVLIYRRFKELLLSMITVNKRRKTILLWKYCLKLLSYRGVKKEKTVSEEEWIKSISSESIKWKTLPLMYKYLIVAKFAEHYSNEQFIEFKNAYNNFKLSLKVKRVAPLSVIPLFIIMLFVSLVFSTVSTSAQEEMEGRTESADSLYAEGRRALSNEYWEKAIDIYMSGKISYPNDVRFPTALAALYYNKELYSLARDEYLICNQIDPLSVFILYRLAVTEGNLNDYGASAAYYEQILAIENNYEPAINGLAWMYYKLHKARQGEKLLLDAINRLGANSDFCMTLATIYSDLFDYEKSKYYYLESVEASRRERNFYSFAALSYYNLSILESRFYNFETAYQTTLDSLQMVDRASGHLARGELNLRRHAFSETFKDFEESYENDRSPLTKLSMAIAYLHTGSLDNALAYSLDCLNQKNLSWMSNYGIDPNTYKRELYDIIYKSYEGLYYKESFFLSKNFKEWLSHICRRIEYKFNAKVNKLLLQKYSLLAADAIYDAGNSAEYSPQEILEGLKYYYFAFSPYKDRALFYLNATKEIEVEIIPKSLPSYLYEEGKLLGSSAILNAALEGFDPVWEQDMLSDTYCALGILAKKEHKNELLSEVSGKLFAMNSGALKQYGLSLPVNLEIISDNQRMARQIKKLLGKSGFKISSKYDSTLRFNMFMEISENADGTFKAVYRLFDTVRGTNKINKISTISSSSKQDLISFCATLEWQ